MELLDEELEALKTLQEMLIPLLDFALLQSQGAYTADNDACDRQIKCLLLPKQPDGHNNQSDIGRTF